MRESEGEGISSSLLPCDDIEYVVDRLSQTAGRLPESTLPKRIPCDTLFSVDETDTKGDLSQQAKLSVGL